MSTLAFRSDLPAQAAPGFPELRNELLALIEQLSSATWTDYNTHDPGITLGEHLIWGITEDCYTAHHPMVDHMTLAEGAVPPPHSDFPAERVLPARAYTFLDYRKLIIDVPGVRNAWLRETKDPTARLWLDHTTQALLHDPPIPGDATEIVLRGFYDVDVAFEDDVAVSTFPARLSAIRGLLEANRNLGELFASVDAAPPEEIGVCADLIVTPEADVAEVMAQIAAALEEFIAPAPRFHSLAERLAAGFTTDETFDGPLLQHGFLDDEEVIETDRPANLRASDLIQVLMDVPNVSAVQRLVMTASREGTATSDAQSWLLPLHPSRAPELSLPRSRFIFYKRGLPFHVSPVEYERRLDALRADRRFRRYPAGSQTVPPPTGRRRRLDGFRTLLNELPLNFGVGPAGLPEDAPLSRLAQARQLKAFFVLAERLLAGHRAQVAALREIISLRRNSPVVKTALPIEVREIQALLETDETHFAGQQQEFAEDESMRLRRRHKIVDHLLARFGETADSLAVAASRWPLGDTAVTAYNSKARWLGALPELARDRATAANLSIPPTAPEEIGAVSGLESRLMTLLGVGRNLPPNASEIVEEATGVRFVLRDPAAGNLAVNAVPHATLEEARSALDAAVRAAPLPFRYRIDSGSATRHRFILSDECGEPVAVSVTEFSAVPEAVAAVQACITFFRSLPPDPPLHLLEHIHLRPLHSGAELLPACECEPGNDPGCFGDDPYSFRATLVLPAWPPRFTRLQYRIHLETVAREFTPAHVFLKICWLDEEQMAAFSNALLAWRRAHAQFLTGAGPDPAAERDALVRIWRNVRSVFPVATLHDCVDGNDENPVVLDNNSLGTFLEADP